MSGSARARHTPRPRPAAKPARTGGAATSLSGWRRWRWVALLVLAGVVGLPLAHAVFGEAVALLGATFLLGLLVGRWTAR